MEWKDGSKFWLEDNGKLGRNVLDEPSIIYASGSKFWYRNGRLFRQNGPAVVYANGDTKYHFVDGIEVRANAKIN